MFLTLSEIYRRFTKQPEFKASFVPKFQPGQHVRESHKGLKKVGRVCQYFSDGRLEVRWNDMTYQVLEEKAIESF